MQIHLNFLKTEVITKPPFPGKYANVATDCTFKTQLYFEGATTQNDIFKEKKSNNKKTYNMGIKIYTCSFCSEQSSPLDDLTLADKVFWFGFSSSSFLYTEILSDLFCM